MADEHFNITLTDAWSLLVAAGDDFTLTLPRRAGPVEVVPMATETEPAADLIGHVLSPAGREVFRVTKSETLKLQRAINAATNWERE